MSTGNMECITSISILELPDEIIEHIMSFLSFEELFKFTEAGEKLRYCAFRGDSILAKYLNFSSALANLNSSWNERNDTISNRLANYRFSPTLHTKRSPFYSCVSLNDSIFSIKLVLLFLHMIQQHLRLKSLQRYPIHYIFS